MANHLSGVWERQIHSARASLRSLFQTNGECLDDEPLLTRMTEVEGILNPRPLTVEVLNDPTSLQLLSLVNILTMKPKVVSPPSGEFSKSDTHGRKHWRHIQQLSNEYLQSLQERQKWEGQKRSCKIGDIFIVYQVNVSRNHWPISRIIGVNSIKKGLVYSVLLRMGEQLGNENSKLELEQPILGSDEV